MWRRALLVGLVLVDAVSPATAGIIGTPKVTYPSVPGSPVGYTVNDIRIDFTGQLFVQELVVELTSGTIYQQTFGTETAPIDALIPIFPDVASDSFVTLGGFTRNASSSVLVPGGSINIVGQSGPKKFDTEGVNIAWAPEPGLVINGGTNFPIARLTFSDNTYGSFFLYSSSGGQGVVWLSVIHQGKMIGLFDPPDPGMPEPSSAMFAGLLLTTCAIRRARTVGDVD